MEHKTYSDPEEIFRIMNEMDSDVDFSSDDSEFEQCLEEDINSDDSESDSEKEDWCEEEFHDRIANIEKKINEPTNASTPYANRKRNIDVNSKMFTRASSSKLEKTSSVSVKSDAIPKIDPQDKYIVKPGKRELSSKSGMVWRTQSMQRAGKTKSLNVVHIRQGPTPGTGYTYDILKCFELFFSENIIVEVLKFTNMEISKQRKKYKSISWTSDICEKELRAIFGLLILSAALKSNHLATRILFNEVRCGSQFLATTSKNRFEFVINCLRFDDRDNRDANDKLAPVRRVWEMLITNCKSHYKPGMYVTIDEQLVGFRGRCPFLMYIPSKPDKYGIKLVMMCDSGTKYMIDAIPYLGKGTVPAGIPSGDYFVEKLAVSISGSHRNITVDNWFTSVPLFNNLLDVHKLTALGTIKKTRGNSQLNLQI